MPTWHPRLGNTGDDAYRWGMDNLINAGTSAYSSPPTLAQVNAGSGLNQIIAETKRQGGGASLSYTDPDTLMATGFFNDMKTAIDTLRSSLGRPAFPWAAWPISTEMLIRDQHLFELRKALAEPLTVNASAVFQVHAQDAVPQPNEPPYPPTASKSCYSGTTATFANGWYWAWYFMGQEKWNVSWVARAFANFTIPPGISGASARLRFLIRRDAISPYCDFTDYNLELYRLDTAIPVPSTQAEIDAAWAAPRTLVASENIGVLCPERNVVYEREFVLDGLSSGDLTLLFANSGELAGLQPVRSPDFPYVECKNADVYRYSGAVYTRLVFE